MTHDKINETIGQLRKIEMQAKALQLKMDNLKDRWEKKYEVVRHSSEWKNSCHEFGTSESYNFGDILA